MKRLSNWIALFTTGFLCAALATSAADPPARKGGGIAVDKDAMRLAAAEGFATATDLADYLVKKGLPFRDAHEAVARAVRHAETNGCDLADLDLAVLQEFSPLVAADVYSVLTLEGSLASRNHIGGTSPQQVRAAIKRARGHLSSMAQ